MSIRYLSSAAAIAALLVPCCIASGQIDCHDYGQDMHVVAELGFVGPAAASCVVGDLAFVLHDRDQPDWYQIAALDLSDAENPSYLGDTLLPYGAMATDISAADGIVYVALGDDGLAVFDFGDPSNPVDLGSFDAGEFCSAILAESGRAFLGVGSAGVLILQTLDPENLAIVGAVDFPGQARGFARDGDTLYVAASTNGLHVLDISDEANPSLVGSVNTPGTAYELLLGVDVVYVADGSGLQVADVSDPTAPALTGGGVTNFNAQSLARSGDLLWAAGPASSRLFDLTNPAAPSELVRLPLGAFGVHFLDGGVFTLLPAGSTSVVANENFSATPEPDRLVLGGSARVIETQGDLAVVSVYANGLKCVDLGADPTPAILGGIDLGGSISDLAIDGDLVYASDDAAAVHVVSIADPGNPSLVSTWSSPGQIYNVAHTGSIVYAGTDLALVHVLDATDPSNVFEASTFTAASIFRDMAVYDGHLFVLNSSRLSSFDLSDPLHPAARAQIQLMGSPKQMVFSGGILYIVGSAGSTAPFGLVAFDLGDPAYPAELSGLETIDFSNAMAVQANFAYVLSDHGGVDLIDISNPLDLRREGTVTGSDWASSAVTRNAATHGGRLVWPAGNSLRFAPLQCDDQVVPTLVRSLTATAAGRVVRIEGALAGDFRLEAISLTARAGSQSWQIALRWSGRDGFTARDEFPADFRGSALTYELWTQRPDGSNELLASTGVKIPASAAKLAILDAWPNPFNPKSEIRFVAPAGSQLRVAIYDLQGRHVDTLFAGIADGAEQSVQWQPRDVASGSYFVRAWSDHGSDARRLTLVK